ncbi:hypothetical protein OQA88_13302 [Cercophora sp. LCS_1]
MDRTTSHPPLDTSPVERLSTPCSEGSPITSSSNSIQPTESSTTVRGDVSPNSPHTNEAGELQSAPTLVQTNTFNGRSAEKIDSRPALNAKPKPLWRQWLAEICFCIASLCSFTIIVAVLGAYDSHPLPKLPMNITLNTFLAFFTTFAKASFTTVISEALSQWKWNMTATPGNLKKRPSNLHEFDVLDNSSRGPWGSWLLIWNFKWRHFVTLAAILSLLSAFTSPVTQLTIAYPIRPSPIPLTVDVPSTRNYSAQIDSRLQTLIDSAVYRGVLGGQLIDTVEHVPLDCPSTQCDFQVYSSLALCMKVGDVSDRLSVTYIPESTYKDWKAIEEDDPLEEVVLEGPVLPGWNATLIPDSPDQEPLQLVTPLSWNFVLAGRDYSLAFKDSNDINTAITHLYLVWSNAGNVSYPGYDRSANPTPWTFNAIEIMYHYCVNTYNTTYTASHARTSIISASNTPLSNPTPQKPLAGVHCNTTTPPWDPIYYRDCVIDPDAQTGATHLQDPADPEMSYSIDKAWTLHLQKRIYYEMAAFALWDGIEADSTLYSERNANHILRIMMGRGLEEREARSVERQVQELSGYFEYEAVSISNFLRTSLNQTVAVNGTSWADTTFVAIHWGWVSFLAVELVLSYLFLVATMHRTAKMGTPVLKSSELATVIAATTEIGHAVGSVNGMEEAKEKAKAVGIRLHEGRLVVA